MIQGDTGCGKTTRIPVYIKELFDSRYMENPDLFPDFKDKIEDISMYVEYEKFK